MASHFNMSPNRPAGVKGLETKPFMPASRHKALSSAKVFAVMARMGTAADFGFNLMRRVAVSPSNSGICISMSIIA